MMRYRYDDMKRILISFLDKFSYKYEIIKDEFGCEYITIPSLGAKKLYILEFVSTSPNPRVKTLFISNKMYDEAVFIVQGNVDLIFDITDERVYLNPLYSTDSLFTYNNKAINIDYMYRMTKGSFESIFH